MVEMCSHTAIVEHTCSELSIQWTIASSVSLSANSGRWHSYARRAVLGSMQRSYCSCVERVSSNAETAVISHATGVLHSSMGRSVVEFAVMYCLWVFFEPRHNDLMVTFKSLSFRRLIIRIKPPHRRCERDLTV